MTDDKVVALTEKLERWAHLTPVATVALLLREAIGVLASQVANIDELRTELVTVKADTLARVKAVEAECARLYQQLNTGTTDSISTHDNP